MPVGSETDFSQAVLDEAREEAEEIVDRARREADRILDSARKELDQIYQHEAPQAQKQQAQTRYNQIISSAELEVRKQELLTRERLIGQVQERVKERLRQIHTQARYPDIMAALIRRGLTEMEGEEFEVLVAAQDRGVVSDAMLTTLQQETGKTLRLADASVDEISGAIIRRTDQRVQCDNSLQAILQRRQEDIRLLIAETLFGEVEES